MWVTLRGLDIGMAEELGDGVERHPALHEAAGKGVAQVVECQTLDTGLGAREPPCGIDGLVAYPSFACPEISTPVGNVSREALPVAESGWTNRAPSEQKGPSCFLPSPGPASLQ